MRSAETCLCTEANSIRRVLRPPPRVRSNVRWTLPSPPDCARIPPQLARAPLEVDKNRGKCPNFVYASAPQYAKKKRPDPVAALPVIHHFTLAAILTSVSIFFPFNVYKTLPLFHVSTFSLAVASSCPPPFVLGAGR